MNFSLTVKIKLQTQRKYDRIIPEDKIQTKAVATMPGIPQINNPVSGKSYSTTNNAHSAPGQEQFDIIQLTKPIETSGVDDRNANSPQYNMGQKDLLPMSTGISKDPTMAVETLKGLINEELVNSAEINGYTELSGELSALSKALYLNPNGLLDEILNQESQNTMFRGNDFYSLLRQAAQGGSDALKASIGNLLKAINYSQSRDEILSALSSNLKFLSEYFAPNTGLSEKLASMSRQWAASDAGEYFELLKNETISLLSNVSESLLNDEKTQTILPLIIHNISKYGDNDRILVEYFNQMLENVPSESMKDALSDAYAGLLKSILTNQELANIDYSNNTTNTQINQDQNAIFGDKNQISAFLGNKLTDKAYLDGLDLENLPIRAYLNSYLSGKTGGMEAIKTILNGLINDNGASRILNRQLDGIRDMTQLVDYLNDILKEMPAIPQRQDIYEALEEIVNKMAEKKELISFTAPENEKAVSSMDALTDFIAKNINHPAIKSIESFNASNLLQSLLNAPGVMTPLAHYIIPLQQGDTRAFGELWVDNDGEKKSAAVSANNNYHLFLTFDVEQTGRFEIDMYANGENISVSLLHPQNCEELVTGISDKITKLAAGSGYRTKEFRTGILTVPHSLTEVFPKIKEKREGMNVKI